MFLLHNLIWLLNSTHYFKMKIPNKRELQQIACSHSSDIDFQDFGNLYKNVLLNHIIFLVVDATLTLDDPSRFRKNLVERI